MSRNGATHMTMLTIGARGFTLPEVTLVYRLANRNDADLDVDLEPLALRHLQQSPDLLEPEREIEPLDITSSSTSVDDGHINKAANNVASTTVTLARV
jgi:hypothetical protein